MRETNKISIGLGTTGNCNLNCPHCYSKPFRGHTLKFEQISFLAEHENISSVNFGTGENILNPDFPKIIDFFYEKGIKMSLTSNGYSVICMSDDILKKFNDIDISLDFADQTVQNDFRNGQSWDFATKAMDKCRKLGIEFSTATALMNINYKEIPFLLKKVYQEGCNLRLNVFKKVIKAGITQFALNYDEFWTAVNLLFSHGKLISCSEPVVNAMLNIKPKVEKSPCGRNSFRIHPNGTIVPCVYWPESKIKILDIEKNFSQIFEEESFKIINTIPRFCEENCEKVNVCGGGCASRRFLNGRLDEPDEYCPIFKKKTIPKISIEYLDNFKDLVHSTYLCTFIFEGKE